MGKFLKGTVFGATVGAVAALLFAPKKGDEFREELGDKVQDFKATALDYVELTSLKGEELKQQALESELGQTLKANAITWKDKVLKTYDDVRESLKQNAEAVEDNVEESITDDQV